jgi:hypothetical protein
MSNKAVISIKDLKKHFPVKNVWGTDIALVKALDGVDLTNAISVPQTSFTGKCFFKSFIEITALLLILLLLLLYQVLSTFLYRLWVLHSIMP